MRIINYLRSNAVGKYLFLYLKTGGGHLAPAKAVAEKIKTKRRVDVEILLVDGLSESNQFIKKVIEDGYKNAAISNGVGQVSDYLLKFQ